jgi:hypothetical protein
MAKHQKTLKKICECPTRSDIKWDDLKSLLEHLGYIVLKKIGKTGGSRRKFFNAERNHLIVCHEPHPRSEVSKGCVEDVAEKLREIGFIK